MITILKVLNKHFLDVLSWFCFLLRHSGHVTAPSNKLPVAALPQKTCRRVAQPPSRAPGPSGLALTCGISSDWGSKP